MDFQTLMDGHIGGVFRIHRALSEAALHPASARALRTVAVRLTTARDKNAFLAGVAGALHFPAHFGRNWDAFYDCLLDIDPGEGGMLIVLRDASAFARAEPDEFAAAVDTLTDAADYWREHKKTLGVVVELDSSALAPELPEVNYRTT
jgi:hypothetical protein